MAQLQVVAFYHPDGVLVEKGKECYHGRKAIKEMFLKFDSMAGKTVSKLHGTTYQMTPDYIIITSDYESTTEKMGVIKGKFSQIWKKENNTYLIYHDQFEML
ncbi:unnamed protein product [Heligmosomoides polygyrus]|uniref:DUF4440 domain-containing protein n=1 Tax=Heligmosomoides polygyrus TaxID=6339 RepID=A0A183FR50_HELPZ|nr:unnamed protein product [Heligmosomoides polygyrus]